MKVELIFSDDYRPESLEKLKTFCQQAEKETKHASSTNMDFTTWETNTASLLYIFLREKRFRKEDGGLLLLYENEDVIAVSGFYRSDFHSDIFILGVRSWVLKDRRFNLLIGEQLLPIQIEEILKKGGKLAVLTFNDATKSFAKLIERSNRDPEAQSKFFFGERYPELYKDMVFYPNPVRIKNTRQWILIKTLKPFEFDWSILEDKS